MATLIHHDSVYRGELNLRGGDPTLRSTRGKPSAALAGDVAYYWLVRWDLEGREPYDQHVLTEPRQHLVFERDGATDQRSSRMVGPFRRRFRRRIDGRREIIGVAFHPGAFRAWLGAPVAALTDQMADLPWPFPDPFDVEGDAARLERIEGALRVLAPDPDPQAARVRRIVDAIAGDAAVTRVEALSQRFGQTPRALQRLFHSHVGVTPKWVIGRYRLLEAARALESGAVKDLAELAFQVGYFDQAHFAKDFKAMVGRSPSEHARLTAAT